MDSEGSRSLYYEQKKENLKESLIFQFSKVLRWLLQTALMGLKAMIKALSEALQMFFRF